MRKGRQRKKNRTITYGIGGIICIIVLVVTLYMILPRLSLPVMSISTKDPEIIRVNETFGVRDLEEALLLKNIPYDSVVVSSSSGVIVTQLSGGPKVFFGYDKEIEWQISSLQQILTRLTIENKEPQVIDLRYNRPIVKF